MKQVLLLFFLILFGGYCFAQTTFSSDFSSYSSNFLILSDTNLSDVTSVDYDANAAEYRATDFNGMNLNFIGYNNFTIPVDVDKDVNNNRSAARIRLDSNNINLTDYNGSGRLHMIIHIDKNEGTGMRMDIRLGQSTTQYWEYRSSYDSANEGWWVGRHDIIFDLNSASAITGTPNLADINFAWVVINHEAGMADYNWTINGIWVEKVNGFSAGDWNIPMYPTMPQGMAIVNQRNELALNNLDRQSYGYHGRIFANAFESLDLTSHSIDLTADLNIVDANWGVRMVWDYLDGHDFTSCFIFHSSASSVRVGYEQWINNVRYFQQVTDTIPYGTTSTLRCSTDSADGKTVTVYVNGVQTLIGDINSRVDGSVGFETFANDALLGGQTTIDNVSFSATPLIDNSGKVQLGAGTGITFDFFKDILFPLILFAIFAVILIAGITTGSVELIISSAVIVILIYIVWNALFF